jgi:hypothetical protein
MIPFVADFSNYFLPLIEQNSQKNVDAPLALVMQGPHDKDYTLFAPAALYNILEISKTHQAAVRILEDKSLWGQTIREASEKYKRKISLLYISTHGEEQRLGCGDKEHLEISDLRREDFDFLASDAIIMLHACKAGVEFARQMAQISGRVVLACEKEFEPIASLFVGSHTPPKLLCYDTNRLEDVLTQAYLPTGRSEPVSASEELKKHLFSEKFTCLKDLAAKGDQCAQFDMAEMLNNGIGVEKSAEQAFYWYSQSAKQGFPKAQYMMGVFYKQGLGGIAPHLPSALYWYNQAAKQEHARAQHNVGASYHRGDPGVEQSDRKALYWYRKAAAQNVSYAIFTIGLFFEEGRGGLPQSDEEALRAYRHAANAGLAHAQYMMAVFHEQGRGGLTPSKEEALQYYNRIGGSAVIARVQQEVEGLRSKQS